MYEGQPVVFRGLERGWEYRCNCRKDSLPIRSHTTLNWYRAEVFEGENIEILVVSHGGLLGWVVDKSRGKLKRHTRIQRRRC